MCPKRHQKYSKFSPSLLINHLNSRVENCYHTYGPVNQYERDRVVVDFCKKWRHTASQSCVALGILGWPNARTPLRAHFSRSRGCRCSRGNFPSVHLARPPQHLHKCQYITYAGSLYYFYFINSRRPSVRNHWLSNSITEFVYFHTPIPAIVAGFSYWIFSGNIDFPVSWFLSWKS